jgi:hypothetical protein
LGIPQKSRVTAACRWLHRILPGTVTVSFLVTGTAGVDMAVAAAG